MTILDVSHVRKDFGAVTVLEKVSFKVNRGEKVGLIGENGCGKSTLLKMMIGNESVTAGTIMKPAGVRIGYLAQHLEVAEGRTVFEELRDVFSHVLELESSLKGAEEAMGQATGDALEQAIARYGRLAEAFEREGGYSFEHRIEAVMDGLRISHMRERRLSDLSGGEKNLVALVRVLLEEPDILLLDEPANHLDFEGLAWLEEFLGSSDRTVILVSHNRYMLDRVVGKIVEIQDGRSAEYVGNYSAFRAQKLRDLIKQKAAFEDQQKEIRRLEEVVKRFELWAKMSSKPRHAIQARNKQKSLDRMDRMDRPQMDRRRIDPNFAFTQGSGKIALEINGYSKGFGDRELFRDVHLDMAFGDRVGLLGANGSGKTTLFKEIVEKASWENSVLRIGPRIRLGYYAQEHETLDPEYTILEAMQRETELTKEQAFGVLSRFLFSWEDLGKKVRSLSGGEKSRMQLARLMVSDVNFLLMDEPTNHLDIQSREKVEEALEMFEGTVLVISHDRYFLDRVVDRIVEIQNPELVEYAGNFSFFWEQRKVRGAIGREKSKRPVVRKKKAGSAGGMMASGDEVERQVDALEGQKVEVERALAEAYHKRDYQRGEKLSQQLKMLDARIEELYERL